MQDKFEFVKQFRNLKIEMKNYERSFDMTQKTKNQHYVPQVYLKKFAIIGSNDKLNVYDKKTNTIRNDQRIDKLASERFFYDVSAEKLIKENPNHDPDSVKQFVDEFNNGKDGSFQYIEKDFFSEIIESELGQLLNKIIKRADKASPWFRQNCYSIMDNERGKLSILMAMQYMRTKRYKEELKNALSLKYKDFFRKSYKKEYGEYPPDFDVNVSDEKFKLRYLANFLLNDKHINSLSNFFYKCNFEFLINETELPYWTSDAPVVITGDRDSSDGSVSYPISSKYLLLLSNNGRDQENIDRCYRVIFEKNKVEIANQLQYDSSSRTIFACDESLNCLLKDT